MHTGTLFDCTKTCLIRINKPPDDRIIIPGLEVVHGDLRIEVITSVAEGVNGGNVAAGGIGSDGTHAPGVVAVGGDGGAVQVGNGNDIALQVLQEVVRRTIVQDAADGIRVVIQRDQLIGTPGLRQNLGAVQLVGMGDTVHRLAGADAVGVVGVGVVVKGLQLPALLPGQGVAKVRGRVALGVIGNGLLAGSITVYSNFALLQN